ncbi:MAG: XRE family transcriptional regulator [Geobacteraceae bacterium GWB2_52_12]|nr:MAG: XRE family transcriptional regulator [Geobacteraceae bacterium GWB2_52_12]
MTIEEAFGIVLRRMRKERGLSQEKLSISSCLDRAFISKIEGGKQQPSLVSIFELATAMNVSACNMVFEAEFLLHCNGFKKARANVDFKQIGWSMEGAMQNSASKYGGLETILIAEDQKNIRDMLALFLNHHGYKVLHAEDGHDALEQYKQNGDSINLVVMDVVMPRIDGITAYNEIRKINPSALIILMSGYHEKILCKDSSMPIMQKPFSPTDMVKKIRTTLDNGDLAQA